MKKIVDKIKGNKVVMGVLIVIAILVVYNLFTGNVTV
tara:strand:+ start:349 stop:459 length:111 start_codon:yes stop_codon:yes gene_type:complete